MLPASEAFEYCGFPAHDNSILEYPTAGSIKTGTSYGTYGTYGAYGVLVGP